MDGVDLEELVIGANYYLTAGQHTIEFYDDENNRGNDYYSASKCCFGCESFNSVIVPGYVTSLYNTFLGCTNLESVNIPNTITRIRDSAFDGCSNLASINIPSGVTEIGGSAFKGCSSLTSINIPNGVTTLGEMSFANCGLTSVIIPSSVTEIGICAFAECENLNSITVEATTPPSVRYNSFLLTNCPIYVPAASVDTYKRSYGWTDYASRIQAIPA